MKMDTPFAAMLEAAAKNKTYTYALYGGVIVIALLLFLMPKGKQNQKRDEKTDIKQHQSSCSDQNALQMETRLENILSCISGAGKVRVMLTLDKTDERVLANEDRTAGALGEIRPSMLASSGKDEATAGTELLPRIRGVIVIAEGAANLTVRQNLMNAVSVVLGIDEKNVEVFVMG